MIRRTLTFVAGALLVAGVASAQSTPNAVTVPWVARSPAIAHDIISGVPTRLKGAEVGQIPVASGDTDFSTIDSITIETLSTCGNDDLNYFLNGTSIGALHIGNAHCMCNPPTTTASFSGAAARAAWNGGNLQANVARFQKPQTGTATLWSAMRVVQNGQAKRICIFDFSGSNCSTTNLCSGHTFNPIDRSRSGAWADAAAIFSRLLFGTRFNWNFGDGTSTGFQAITDSRVLEATHTYSGAAGSPFNAVLTVCDDSDHCDSASYPMTIRADNLDSRTNVAIDEGLWYLYKKAKSGGQILADGSYGDQISATASAVNAFEAHGHTPSIDRNTDPYIDVVTDGLDYTFAHLQRVAIGAQQAGNPDANGNGFALTVTARNNEVYENGMVMDAIVTSGTQNAQTAIGGANYTYKDAVQDLVDGYAWGQGEPSSGASVRGGWNYNYNNGSGGGIDNSASQWAAIGMIPAERQWAVTIPAFVKSENLLSTAATANTNGAGTFGYNTGGCVWGCAATTPSGVVQLSFDDVASSDARYTSPMRWMADNWGAGVNEGNGGLVLGYTYGMFAAYKSLKLAQPAVDTLTTTGGQTFDWYNDPTRGIRAVTVGRQYGSGAGTATWGRWDARAGAGQTGLATQWHLLMLAPTLFQQGPKAVATADPTTVAIGQTVTFDHSGSFHLDADHHIIRYDWDFDSDGTIDFTTNDPNAHPTHAYDPDPHGVFPQTFTATLKVTDDNDPALTDTARVQITVRLDNVPPVAVITPASPSGLVNTPIAVSGADSFDPNAGEPLNDSVVAWDWDLDESDGLNQFTTSGVDQTVQFATAGDHHIALRVTDSFGATHVAFATVNVIANRPPVAVATPDGATIECVSTTGDSLTSVVLDGTGSSDPDGDALSYSWSPAAGLIDAHADTTAGRFPIGQSQVTLTVTDTKGASSSDTASFTVRDTTAPEIRCHDDVVECAGPDGTAADPSASAIDACQGDVAANTDAPLPALYPRGVTVETFGANDAYGNLATCDAQVIVQDTTAPTIVCPDDATRDADASCHGDFNLMAQASDACDGALDVTASQELGAVFGLGSTLVTYNAIDADRNPASCATTVTVVDHSAPSLSCPAPVTVATDADRCDAAVPVAAPTGHDNCDGDLAAAGDVPARFERGTTNLSFGVADHAGNAQSCSTSVTVEDRQAPSIECPAPIEVPTGPTGCSAVVNNFAAAASDNCDLVAATQLAPAGNVYGLGTTDVTFRAVDQSGNANTCGTSVTVVDTGDPTVACVPLVVATADPDTCGVHVDVTPPTTSDDCGGSLTVDSDAPDVFDLGSTVVHYTVTDAAGNHTSCTTTVRVDDVTAPAITCPPATTVAADAQTCRQTVDTTATATDACSDTLAFAGNGSFSYGLGTTTHTVTVTDGSGNSSSCDTDVTIVDATPPVMTVRTGISLWPPNHKYQRISTADCVAAIRDACDGQARSVGIGDVVVTGVSSDEVEDSNGNGDGATRDDMVIVDSSHVDLRAEREGTGNGRVYSIQLRVADAAGNVTTGVCKVGVPHDQGGQPAAVEGPGPGYSIP